MKKLLALLLLSFPVFSAEKDINQIWCSSMNGDYEFITKDGTYVDCLTNEFAVEQDSFICGVIATPHAEYPDNMARLSSLRSVRLAVMLSNMVSFY